MNNILKRTYDLSALLQPNKVFVLYGPRQVGKTTLIDEFLKKTSFKYIKKNGDSLKTQELFASLDSEAIVEFATGYELIVLDEAQKIPNIGIGLKILVDSIPGIHIVVTGSSSFDLAQQIGEPLTGRKRTHILYPFSQSELLKIHNRIELKNNLEEYLIYGGYPEVVTAHNRVEKKQVLEELADSYLLKDVLSLHKIKKSDRLVKLLRLLAFQIGSEVSFHELAVQLGMDVKTVENYIDILQKAFVVKYIGAYSRNLRTEISKKGKIYFYDTGIRNAIINNYNDLDRRNDIGALWENFLVMERLKKQEYEALYSNNFFWRTYEGAKVDWIEERDGTLFAYEFKWNTKKKVLAPKDWTKHYEHSKFQVITPDNYLDFIV